LTQIRGIGEEKAAKLLEAARNAVAAAEAPADEGDSIASGTAAEVENTNPAAEYADADGSSEQLVEGIDGDREDSPEPAQSADEPEPEKKIEPLGGSNGKD